jgi:hypothetical protein
MIHGAGSGRVHKTEEARPGIRAPALRRKGGSVRAVGLFGGPRRPKPVELDRLVQLDAVGSTSYETVRQTLRTDRSQTDSSLTIASSSLGRAIAYSVD